MLFNDYYAQNYAGIIRTCLATTLLFTVNTLHYYGHLFLRFSWHLILYRPYQPWSDVILRDDLFVVSSMVSVWVHQIWSSLTVTCLICFIQFFSPGVQVTFFVHYYYCVVMCRLILYLCGIHVVFVRKVLGVTRGPCFVMVVINGVIYAVLELVMNYTSCIP